MSPEQARGKTADRRSDIWAFGVILYEMLTGRRLFKGETVTDTLAKVLERDPDWKQLPSRVPAPIRKLLRRCLTKSVKDRLQAIGDARMILQESANPAAVQEDVEVIASPRWKKMAPWILAPLFLAAGWLLRSSGTTEHGISRFEYLLPDNQNLIHNYRHGLDLSADGKRMAFVASSLSKPDAQRKIYVRSLDQWDAVALAGTEGARNPFFSPDGQWLGYAQNRQIKKVALSGGPPVVLVEKVADPVGLTWGSSGIVFAADIVGGLKITKDTGGDPEDFTQLDAGAQEISHRLLPSPR